MTLAHWLYRHCHQKPPVRDDCCCVVDFHFFLLHRLRYQNINTIAIMILKTNNMKLDKPILIPIAPGVRLTRGFFVFVFWFTFFFARLL
jgi:hypothetical protein